ncbi:MAG: hypothetical protein KI792_08980 [Alphaproteobacteria bacterium]|nr:hypothetical protein [Alphaproteobacteria bacterium SS10]
MPLKLDREPITPELIALAERMGDRLAEHRLLSPTWKTDHGFTMFFSELIPFYPGARRLIFPIARARPGQLQERVVVEHQDYLYIMAGGLEPLVRANEAVPLTLSTSNVLDYVRFYLEHVTDKAGGIRLAEQASDIPWREEEGAYQAPQVNPLVRPLSLIDTDDDGYLVIGTGLYQDALFRATFRIGFDGMLEIADEEQIAGDLRLREDPMVAGMPIDFALSSA